MNIRDLSTVGLAAALLLVSLAAMTLPTFEARFDRRECPRTLLRPSRPCEIQNVMVLSGSEVWQGQRGQFPAGMPPAPVLRATHRLGRACQGHRVGRPPSGTEAISADTPMARAAPPALVTYGKEKP